MRNKNEEKGLRGTYVEVRNNDINGAIRRLKKIVTAEGIIKEYRDKQFYTQPSEKRRMKKAAAIRRYKKELAKRDNY